MTKNNRYSLEDFSQPLSTLLMPANHLWVNSGSTTVHPAPDTVSCVTGIFGPPFALPDFNFQVSYQINDTIIADTGSRGKGDVGLLYSGGTWYPDRIKRRGTYHHYKTKGLLSFSVQSELIPLYHACGFILKISLNNRLDQDLSVRLQPLIEAGAPYYLNLNQWQYSLARLKGKQACKTADKTFANSEVNIEIKEVNTNYTLAPKATVTSYFAVQVSQPGKPFSNNISLPEWEKKTQNAWQTRLEKYTASLPELSSSLPGLNEYYLKSLISGLVCIWENPNFQVNPHIATSGMDGGAICSYVWDLGGYAPNMLVHMLKEEILPIIRQFLHIDLSQAYAFTPGGKGIGVYYAYSPWSLMKLIRTAFCHLQPDKSLYQAVRDLFLKEEEKSSQNKHLIDYGSQENLLEMRSAGWEHYVASPNAERAWCYQRLAEMGALFNEPDHQLNKWKNKAAAIAQAIKKQLWDTNEHWFKCLYPNEHEELVYSIQAFDTIAAGICSPDMIKQLVSHLNENEFLGTYGVHSISPGDQIHFELNDPDWSGGGAYCGESPQLAQTLYQAQQPHLALNILKRLFWMGKHLAYFPQEHYADKPGSPAAKRANVIAGLTGAEAILYGLIGIEIKLDGSLWINPRPMPGEEINIRDYCFKNRALSIHLKENQLIVKVEEQLIYEGPPLKMRVF